MKKRSNITLLILFLMLFSIPVAAYCYFRQLVKDAEKNPQNREFKEIRLKTSNKDSIQISFDGDDVNGFKIKASVKKKSEVQ